MESTPFQLGTTRSHYDVKPQKHCHFTPKYSVYPIWAFDIQASTRLISTYSQAQTGIIMRKLPRISDTEWEIMRVIWAREPVTAAEIIEDLQAEDATWHPITAKTLLNRLVKKGAIDFTTRGRAYVYASIVKETECVRAVTDSFLDRVFGGSMATMLAHFVGQRKLTPKQQRDLRKVLD